MASLETCLARWATGAEPGVTYQGSSVPLVLASLSKGGVTLWQKRCHQPAERQGRARVSARSYRETHLGHFKVLPRFLLGWFLMATGSTAPAPKGNGSAGPSASKLQLRSPTCWRVHLQSPRNVRWFGVCAGGESKSSTSHL